MSWAIRPLHGKSHRNFAALRGREILEHGTSAHQQLGVYKAAVEAGAEPDEALRKVVDFLITETVAGL